MIHISFDRGIDIKDLSLEDHKEAIEILKQENIDWKDFLNIKENDQK